MKLIKEIDSALTPIYASPAAAGFDFSAADEVIVYPFRQAGEVELIHTGLVVAFPEGFELQIRQRSGLSIKYPSYLANSVGTIDSDYRGEIRIPVVNWTEEPWLILPGDRIAQGIMAPIVQAEFDERAVYKKQGLPKTVRGTGGFGSTGGK